MKQKITRKQEEGMFMYEFMRSSKVWGISLICLGAGYITIPIVTIITKDMMTLLSGLILGLVCILIGMYMFLRYDWVVF